MKALRRLTVRAALPAPLAPLGDIVANLRWSWHPESLDLLESVDPELWAECNGDPARLLGGVSTDRLAALAKDRKFLRRLQDVSDDLRDYLEQPRWYQRQQEAEPGSLPSSVAYFSPEFGITEVLPQYSGGLGILAGDHLKAASDLGAPIIGVGLLYRAGYFSQSLSREGWQQERYPSLDPQGLPLTPLRDGDGNPARVTLDAARGPDAARPDLAGLGRPGAAAAAGLRRRGERRGRPRGDRPALRRRPGAPAAAGAAAGHRRRPGAAAATARSPATPSPEVFHTNEGHAGFLGIERISELADGPAKLTFDEALTAVRAGTVFTTHTPVPAGIDRFERDLVRAYLGQVPGVPVDRILALGAEEDPTKFNMAHMGLRLGQRANGVAQLHGRVSRSMFNDLWPGLDAQEVPITSITNGVHAPTWMAREFLDLAQRNAGSDGPGRRRGLGRHRPDLRRRAVGAQARAARAAGRRDPPPDPAVRPGARLLRRGAGLDRHRLRPGRADHRLRPPGALLQAADPDAARPGPAEEDPHRPGASGADRGGRQVAPGRRRRQGADRPAGPVHRRPRGARPDRLPARLRHRHGALPVLGQRRLAEQPAAAAGGLRHVRHEGGAERRPEPVHQGRLVGRVVRGRQERLGDPVGQRLAGRHHRRPPGRGRGGRPCTT